MMTKGLGSMGYGLPSWKASSAIVIGKHWVDPKDILVALCAPFLVATVLYTTKGLPGLP